MPPDDWQREMERYLAHFNRAGKRPTILFTHLPQPQVTTAWTPAVDMYETDAALVVLLDLAGVDSDATDVQAEPHRLTVRGVRRERHAPHSDAQRSYHTLEIPYGRFERTVRLPPGTDVEGAHASYRDGLLEITLPKRVPRQVPIIVQEQAPTDAGRR
jgi:HSP20 family protein